MKKTIVYIDGYNLYYSLLRRTPYKWLDVVALFQSIIKAQDSTADVIQIKYFTAPALAKFASHGKDSVSAQNEYHRALKAKYGELIEIVSGYHTATQANLMSYIEPPQTESRHKVWLIEEKQTDVNIALTIYRDIAKNNVDQVVVCTNDSDMVPALQSIVEDFSECVIGLVVPIPEPKNDVHRYPNAELKKLAHWTRHYIRCDELNIAQLPNTVPTRKKAARRPAHW